MDRPQRLIELENISDSMDQRYTGVLSEPYDKNDNFELQQITIGIPIIIANALEKMAAQNEMTFDSAVNTALINSSVLEDYV